VDSETKLLSAPSVHGGSNLPRKECRQGKEGVGGREKIDPGKQGKRKKILFKSVKDESFQHSC